jgi:hypothetical protein
MLRPMHPAASRREPNPMRFFASASTPESAVRQGFRTGSRGTHSSRTLMLNELGAVLAAVPREADRSAYAAAIVEDNCLAKSTVASRRLSNQRLGELYALDRRCPLFRVLRALWDVETKGQPLLALLSALARDPLLLATAAPVLDLQPGAELQRAAVKAALREAVGERLNDAVLEKVLRNTASSWTQAGHLEGRTFKIRCRVEATPRAVAFALFLAHAAGFRGNELLANGWVIALDASPSAARALALEAKRLGLLDLRSAGDVLEVGFERLSAAQGA